MRRVGTAPPVVEGTQSDGTYGMEGLGSATHQTEAQEIRTTSRAPVLRRIDGVTTRAGLPLVLVTLPCWTPGVVMLSRFPPAVRTTSYGEEQ